MIAEAVVSFHGRIRQMAMMKLPRLQSRLLTSRPRILILPYTLCPSSDTLRFATGCPVVPTANDGSSSSSFPNFGEAKIQIQIIDIRNMVYWKMRVSFLKEDQRKTLSTYELYIYTHIVRLKEKEFVSSSCVRCPFVMVYLSPVD